MITSQFGDVEEMLTDRNVTMVQYLDYFYGFKHDFQGVVAAVVVGQLYLALLRCLHFCPGFKVSAESGMTQPSRIRLDTCHDETDTRYSIMHELGWESVRLDRLV